jgi:hypothetical protein
VRIKEQRTAYKRYNKIGFFRFHRYRLCSLKHLLSLHTFPDKVGQVVLADCEQQFIPALAINLSRETGASAVVQNCKKDNHETFNIGIYNSNEF